MTDRTATSGVTAAPPAQDRRLRAALAEANLPTLLLVLTQLTGDSCWLDEPYRPKRGRPLDDNDSAGLEEELQERVRDAAYQAVLDHRAGRLHPVHPGPEQVARMLELALGEEVPASYGTLLSEEIGLISRDVPMPASGSASGLRVIVIGAGLSGICAAIKLKAAGIDFTVLEKDPDVGGTWLENVYPGCGVDTPSHLYSFSFAPNTEWSRYFAKRDQVFGYLSRLADTYGLREHIRFTTEVLSADWDSPSATWQVRVRRPDGSHELIVAPILVSAVGMVNRPSWPRIEGLEEFDGPLMHTAAWDAEVDLRGKRVAVIGTGASAMQLVPAIADDAERVVVFQRSKQWALPHPNYHRDVSPAVTLLMEQVPFYIQWYRLRAFWNFSDRLHPALQIDPEWAHPGRSINATNERHRVFLTRYMAEQLGDRAEELLPECLPDYPPYVKRPLLDNGWFRTIRRTDVELVTEAVSALRPHSVVTASGREVEVDVVVVATGFRTLQFLWPMEIRGRSGRTLREQWGRDDARAYLGMTVPDFPNFFILNGPNTNAGHGGSAVLPTEFQTRYLLQALRHLLTHDLDALEVNEDVFWDYNVELDEALSRSIWSHKGGTTYYRNDAGRVVVSSPWKYVDYWQRMLHFDPEQYVESPSRTEPAVAV